MRTNNSVDVLILMPSLEDRTALWRMLRQEEEINVVAVTTDSRQARQQLRLHRPSVLLMAWELPLMHGSQYLQNLPRNLQVIGISAEEDQNELNELTSPNLLLLSKKQHGLGPLLPRIKEAIFSSRIQMATMVRETVTYQRTKIIAIGASTGGTEALRTIIKNLKVGLPPILVTQHIAKDFSKILARDLNALSGLEVLELNHTVQPRANHMYIAPGNRHMTLARRDGSWWLELDDGPELMRHKPSVNKMFESVANVAGQAALGILLTGMGADGAKGLLSMYQAGARTLVQDEQTCVVFGMPKEALALGATKLVLPLHQIAAQINRCKS